MNLNDALYTRFRSFIKDTQRLEITYKALQVEIKYGADKNLDEYTYLIAYIICMEEEYKYNIDGYKIEMNVVKTILKKGWHEWADKLDDIVLDKEYGHPILEYILSIIKAIDGVVPTYPPEIKSFQFTTNLVISIRHLCTMKRQITMFLEFGGPPLDPINISKLAVCKHDNICLRDEQTLLTELISAFIPLPRNQHIPPLPMPQLQHKEPDINIVATKV